MNRVAGGASRPTVSRLAVRRPRVRETRRTPWSAAGWNRPATSAAEETVEVVRNHEGGTCLEGGPERPKLAATPVGVDATKACRRRGAKTNSQERQVGLGTFAC